MVQQFLDWLGYPIRDKVTGFAGVADSVCFDLYGCVQVHAVPPHNEADKERRHGAWLDVNRIEKTGARVMEPPTFRAPGEARVIAAPGDERGPADKASRA